MRRESDTHIRIRLFLGEEINRQLPIVHSIACFDVTHYFYGVGEVTGLKHKVQYPQKLSKMFW